MTTSAAEIWATLSQYDVSNHIEKKGNFDYLSWTWAWATLMKHYPEATFRFLQSDDRGCELFYSNADTAEVRCVVTIGEVSREMWLPIKDNRHNAIELPDSREVNDAKMRCLVKCLSLFGLGFTIFAGEDLPDENAEPRQERSRSQGSRARPQAQARDTRSRTQGRTPERAEPVNYANNQLVRDVRYASSLDVLDDAYDDARNTQPDDGLMEALNAAYDARKAELAR